MSNDLIPFNDLKEMANVMGKNNLFGKKPEELLPLFLLAQAEGKHPAVAAQEYDLIQGKPALKSIATLARFQRAGGIINWIKRTDTEASAKFIHAQGGEVVITWTIDRASRAGLTGKDNWKKFPAQMLSARVVAEGVRAVYPACMNGLYVTEEIQDFDDRPKTGGYKAAAPIQTAPEPEQEQPAEYEPVIDRTGTVEDAELWRGEPQEISDLDRKKIAIQQLIIANEELIPDAWKSAANNRISDDNTTMEQLEKTYDAIDKLVKENKK